MTKLGHVICILCKYIHAMREKFTYARVPRRVHVSAPMVKEIVYLLCIFNDNFSSPTWPPRNFMPVAYIQSQILFYLARDGLEILLLLFELTMLFIRDDQKIVQSVKNDRSLPQRRIIFAQLVRRIELHFDVLFIYVDRMSFENESSFIYIQHTVGLKTMDLIILYYDIDVLIYVSIEIQ